jgi:hypothetical protein
VAADGETLRDGVAREDDDGEATERRPGGRGDREGESFHQPVDGDGADGRVRTGRTAAAECDERASGAAGGDAGDTDQRVPGERGDDGDDTEPDQQRPDRSAERAGGKPVREWAATTRDEDAGSNAERSDRSEHRDQRDAVVGTGDAVGRGGPRQQPQAGESEDAGAKQSGQRW